MKNNLKHVHLLGIGGTGMGSLARLLVNKGLQVSGSDEKLYPPMSDQLAQLKINIYEGYAAKHLNPRPDLVVIGNVIRKENEEAQAVLNQDIAYCSMPQAISNFFLDKKKPIVVCGTHGKTTTSTLLAWLLEASKQDPSFFIGGVGRNFGQSAKLGKGNFFVLEGDEYDTAFFDKGPKFLHYQAQVVLLTSIEFDHADIYQDLNQIKQSFIKLLRGLPSNALVVANGDEVNVREILGQTKAKVLTYGLTDQVDYHPVEIIYATDETVFELIGPKFKGSFRLPLAGEHNLLNAIGSIAVLLQQGINKEDIQKGLVSFEGVKRRQEIFAEVNSITLVDDFAHHPTAVAKTIAAIRQKYPNRRLWAIFEPRSNTSRRNFFQKEYIDALSLADRVILAPVFAAEKIPLAERFNGQAVADAIMRRGVDAHYISKTEYILEYITRVANRQDVILVMSNGAFDGLLPRLKEELGKRRII
ncbi:MAG: UDP-N-acetylmuramate:L-alanyl-gamma-D-glutamyl-meso-diaminopimelate ligase [Pseudomonadota bacterium]